MLIYNAETMLIRRWNVGWVWFSEIMKTKLKKEIPFYIDNDDDDNGHCIIYRSFT